MGKLEGRVAVITGGGRGIGKRIALAFAAESASVTIAARTEAELRATAKELERLGGRVEAIPADISSEEDVERLFQRTVEVFGTVDVLVNNAGFGREGKLHELSVDDWDAVMATNLRGAFLCTRAAMRIMIPKQRGRIINIGSISAQRPRLNSAAYTTSKFGLWGLTQCTALEGRAHGISCGILHPGNVLTERRAQRARLQDSEPMISGDDIAQQALLMASMPDNVNVLAAIVMPTGQLYVGRG